MTLILYTSNVSFDLYVALIFYLRKNRFFEKFSNFTALAEAGIVLSKLSHNNASSALEDSKNQDAKFFPERYSGVYFSWVLSFALSNNNLLFIFKKYTILCRFISRQDLINWKAKLDYEVMPGINEEVGKN